MNLFKYSIGAFWGDTGGAINLDKVEDFQFRGQVFRSEDFSNFTKEVGVRYFNYDTQKYEDMLPAYLVILIMEDGTSKHIWDGDAKRLENALWFFGEGVVTYPKIPYTGA